MQCKLFFCILLFAIEVICSAQKTNPAPSQPVIDDYFGTKITDEYRNLEDLKNPATISWMQSQADFADAVLKKLPYRKYFIDERLKFDKRSGFWASGLKITGHDLSFYLKKAADEKVQKLYFRKGFNGKEASEVIIMDVKTRYIYPQVITNLEPAAIGQIKWLEDNNSFFYTYFPITDTNSPEYNKNTGITFYRLGENPQKRNNVFSRLNNPELNIDESRFPGIVQFNEGDPYFIGSLGDVDDFTDTFIIDRKDFEKGIRSWKPLFCLCLCLLAAWPPGLSA